MVLVVIYRYSRYIHRNCRLIPELQTLIMVGISYSLFIKKAVMSTCTNFIAAAQFVFGMNGALCLWQGMVVRKVIPFQGSPQFTPEYHFCPSVVLSVFYKNQNWGETIIDYMILSVDSLRQCCPVCRKGLKSGLQSLWKWVTGSSESL